MVVVNDKWYNPLLVLLCIPSICLICVRRVSVFPFLNHFMYVFKMFGTMIYQILCCLDDRRDSRRVESLMWFNSSCINIFVCLNFLNIILAWSHDFDYMFSKPSLTYHTILVNLFFLCCKQALIFGFSLAECLYSVLLISNHFYVIYFIVS